MAAAGGVDPHPTGAAARGDDDVGDEIVLEARFPAGIGLVALGELEAALEDVLDVGLVVTAV